MELLLPIVSGIGSVCAILFGVAALLRNKKTDTTSDAKQDATVLSEIGYIKANTDEIKSEQKEQRKTNIEFITRLTAVEASAKQAHKRLDQMEGREYPGHSDDK